MCFIYLYYTLPAVSCPIVTLRYTCSIITQIQKCNPNVGSVVKQPIMSKVKYLETMTTYAKYEITALKKRNPADICIHTDWLASYDGSNVLAVWQHFSYFKIQVHSQEEVPIYFMYPLNVWTLTCCWHSWRQMVHNVLWYLFIIVDA